MLEKNPPSDKLEHSSVVCFGCADVAWAVRELKERGLGFSGEPHLIAKIDKRDLWTAFFADADAHRLAPMQEAPEGYSGRSTESRALQEGTRRVAA